jgi:effector-binding domain-containing protein
MRILPNSPASRAGMVLALLTALAVTLALADAVLADNAATPVPVAPSSTAPSNRGETITPPASPDNVTLPTVPPAIPSAASAPPASAATSPSMLEILAQPVLLAEGDSRWNAGYKDVRTAITRLQGEASNRGLVTKGRPRAVFLSTSEDGFHYQVMVPLAEPPPAGYTPANGIRAGLSMAGKAYKFEHRGAYAAIDVTYEAIIAWLDEKGLEAREAFVEEYINDVTDPDDANLAVDIYVFVK